MIFYLFNISDFHSQFLLSKAGFHILPPQANISHNSFLFWRECPEQVLLWNISTFYFSTKVQNLLWPWIFFYFHLFYFIISSHFHFLMRPEANLWQSAQSIFCFRIFIISPQKSNLLESLGTSQFAGCSLNNFCTLYNNLYYSIRIISANTHHPVGLQKCLWSLNNSSISKETLPCDTCYRTASQQFQKNTFSPERSFFILINLDQAFPCWSIFHN